jgi:hypothetical protein
VLPGDATAPLLVLDAEVWWPSFVEGLATVKFADGTQREASFEPGGRAPGLLLATKPELLGTTCKVTLSHRIRGSDEAWTNTSPVEIAIPAPQSARPPNGALIAESDGALRDAVAAAFAEGLVVWKSGTPRAGLRFNTAATADERFTDVAIGLVVELLEDGVPRRTSRIWWRGGIAGASPRWLPSEEDVEALGRLWAAPTGDDTAEDRRWSLRIRGDAQLATYAQYLATEDARTAPPIILTRRFEGSVEIPVVVERMNAPSPARRWMEQRTPPSE